MRTELEMTLKNHVGYLLSCTDNEWIKAVCSKILWRYVHNHKPTVL